MIFVCVGSREYQFNRLLREIDLLIDEGKITEEVFAQIGQSDYIPQNYSFKRFLSPDEFKKYQQEANIIISHAGTGALIGALKLGKKVIAVPRLAKYGEHIDDHQIQIAQVLHEQNYLHYILDIKDLGNVLTMYKDDSYEIRPYNKESMIIPIIKQFLDYLN